MEKFSVYSRRYHPKLYERLSRGLWISSLDLRKHGLTNTPSLIWHNSCQLYHEVVMKEEKFLLALYQSRSLAFDI